MGYGDEVWLKLRDMPDGEIVIEKQVRPENREKFVESVKYFINNHPYDFVIEFSNDYKKVRKWR